MEIDKEFEKFERAVKLIITMQASLEQMDEFKGTPLYRQDIKSLINTLEKKIEKVIRPHIKALAISDEAMMMQISRGIDTILEYSLEELHNVKIIETDNE